MALCCRYSSGSSAPDHDAADAFVALCTAILHAEGACCEAFDGDRFLKGGRGRHLGAARWYVVAMATIVMHRESGQSYLLVGTGYGMSESSTPNLLLGNWSPDVDKSSVSLVALCDSNGAIAWARFEDVMVTTIDGKPPQHWLSTVPHG